MSAVVYNQDGRWGIPAFVWPVVVAASLAVHASLLEFGLPDMSWLQDAGLEQTETEVVLDSSGLEFETVTAVETVAVERPVPEAAPAIAPIAVSPSAPPGIVASPVPPLTSESLRPAQTNTQQVAVTTKPSVPEVKTIPSAEVKAKEVPAVQTAPADRPDAAPLKTVAAEPVAVVASRPEPAGATIVVPANNSNPVDISRPPVQGAPSVIAVAPAKGVLLQTPSSEGPAPVQVVRPSSSSSGGLVVVSRPAETVNLQGKDVAVSNPSNVSVPTMTGEKTVVAAPSLPVVAPVPAAGAATGNAQAVRPVEQQIASLQPAEEPPAAIAPSLPETSPVPSAILPADPAENVAPVEVASIDPLARVTSYVSGYDAGECTHLSVLSAGPDSAAVTAYGAGIGPFAVFDQKFTADQGYEAKVEVRLVTRNQCALLDALDVSKGLEAAGLVELEKTIVRSGTPVSGIIQRDLPTDRIAAAEQAGMKLDGKGPPELYLIDDAGQIHDARDYILPASNPVTAGGWHFSVPVTLLSKEERETALVLAVWNRPKSSQPAKFGTLPPERIAGVLSAPGVFSLSAFAVAR